VYLFGAQRNQTRGHVSALGGEGGWVKERRLEVAQGDLARRQLCQQSTTLGSPRDHGRIICTTFGQLQVWAASVWGAE